MGYDGGGAQWWGLLLGTFMMVAFFSGLIMWGIWYLVTSPARHTTKPAASARAKEILDVQLAGGEAGAGDYDRLRKLMDAPAEKSYSEPEKVAATRV